MVYLDEKFVLYFFLRHKKRRVAPAIPVLNHAGQSNNFVVNFSGLSGDRPVTIVKTSDVAILTYSPVPKAAIASADAVKIARIKSDQPNMRPANMIFPDSL